MVQSFTEDFEVVWSDPADAEQAWHWDAMHQPRPIPPLGHDLIHPISSKVFGARSLSINGYLYELNSVPPPPTPEIIERGVQPVWEGEYVPTISAICEKIRSAPYDGMSAAEIADSLDGIIQECVEAFRLTMVPVFAFMGPTFELLMSCEGAIGPDGEQILATLLQGFENGSASAGFGLGELAEVAARNPEVAAALRDERHDDLRTAEGGSEFARAFDDYLNVYGWRAESWGLPHLPTWCEQPSVPLLLIGRYLKDGASTPAAAIQRARLQREDAMREVESRLSGDALADFKAKLAAIQIHVPISEGRAHWQLTIIGSFRVPALALGKKLVAQGVVREPNDVFYLSLGELKEAARDGGTQKEVVRQRKADLERWEDLAPPQFVGTPPTAIPEEMRIITSKFFGLGVAQSGDKRIVTGNPASRGVARGRARVIRDLSDAARLEKGDILVCTSTAPPWTPLFAIAAGIVTDTGGILSHSAICAREYGIPCVVGTQVGTRQIPDGAMVSVDGAAGTVRIED